MNGSMVIETINGGLSVETKLTDVGIQDKLMILDAVSRALNMTSLDILVFATMSKEGVFDESREIQTVYDHSKNGEVGLD